jgi:HlyD family secretion protein
LRSTGLAASQSAISSQEAKDFKVVIALDNPPDEMRPGLSCTAKIITATRQKSVTIPIQALTVRQKGDLEPRKEGEKEPELPTDPAALRARKEELQGVFVIQGDKAVFKKVETGITGITDIEVLSGLNEGEEIITGSYKVIRTLRNEAKIKVDNKSPVRRAANNCGATASSFGPMDSGRPIKWVTRPSMPSLAWTLRSARESTSPSWDLPARGSQP